MGKSSNQKQAEANNLSIQQQQLAALKQANAIQQKAYGQISPFATQALGMGSAALNGQVPNQFLLPIRNQIASSFQQSNQNLVDALGANGQAGSGIAAGPLANMEQQQGVATGNATLQALLQGLGIGFQGSNALQGQQAIFNPIATGTKRTTGAGQSVIQAPGGFGHSLLGGVLSAGGGALSSWLGRPRIKYGQSPLRFSYRSRLCAGHVYQCILGYGSAVQKSTTACGDQAATPPGPGQVINPADQARTKMQPPTSTAKLAAAPSSLGGFGGGIRKMKMDY
jgi:hypothetical protein